METQIMFDRSKLRPLGVNRFDNWIDFDAMESPLEWRFAWQMGKTKIGIKDVYVQVPILNYRVDFMVFDGDTTIVVELDGKAFHDQEKDAERDSQIIEHVDAIIRIPYVAMIYAENATMAAMSDWFERFRVPEEIGTIGYQDAAVEVNEMKQIGVNTNWMQVYRHAYDRCYVGSFEQVRNLSIVPMSIRTRGGVA